MSTKTFNYPFRVGTDSEYGQVLNQLNTKLDSLKKQVSYFDFYNITGAVTNIDAFSAQLNNLPLNQSLVINTPPFNYNNENYAPGDVVVKNHLGEVYHIKSQTGGVFYPQKIEGSSGYYTIHFGFSGSAPTTPSSSNAIKDASGNIIGYGNTASFAETISYANLQAIQSASIYGLWAKLTLNNNSYSYTFPVAKTTDSNNTEIVVNPSIQFYLCATNSDIPEEQVFIEYSLSHDNVNWTVSVLATDGSDNIYVKVK